MFERDDNTTEDVRVNVTDVDNAESAAGVFYAAEDKDKALAFGVAMETVDRLAILGNGIQVRVTLDGNVTVDCLSKGPNMAAGAEDAQENAALFARALLNATLNRTAGAQSNLGSKALAVLTAVVEYIESGEGVPVDKPASSREDMDDAIRAIFGAATLAAGAGGPVEGDQPADDEDEVVEPDEDTDDDEEDELEAIITAETRDAIEADRFASTERD